MVFFPDGVVSSVEMSVVVVFSDGKSLPLSSLSVVSSVESSSVTRGLSSGMQRSDLLQTQDLAISFFSFVGFSSH